MLDGLILQVVGRQQNARLRPPRDIVGMLEKESGSEDHSGYVTCACCAGVGEGASAGFRIV